VRRNLLVAFCAFVLALALASVARAQMGMDMFKKPAVAKAFHPIIGKGAEYETTSSGSGDAKTRTMEMGVVGKESVDGKDGYWMQFVMTSNKGTMVGKALITGDDFQFHKMIVQPPGQQAMEMPMTFAARNHANIDESMANFHSVGTETVTVPAGTFSCDHLKNDKDGSEIWTSEKVSPYGLVKRTAKDGTTVLVKILDDYQDRITGPVRQFDMQQMMQQRQPAKP
jgi:hypothetical protein